MLPLKVLPPATYRQMLDYLHDLGIRHSLIGRAEFTSTGEASSDALYPLLLVEIDTQASELTPGVESFSFAIQVLDKHERPNPADLPDLLVTTNDWADQLKQQLRDERPGQLLSSNKLALPGEAGAALATGWRLELQLKLANSLNRSTNSALFAPLS